MILVYDEYRIFDRWILFRETLWFDMIVYYASLMATARHFTYLSHA